MEIDDYPVSPLQNGEIDRLAGAWRKHLNRHLITNSLDAFAFFADANQWLEKPIEVEVRPDTAMGRANAYVSPDRRKVYFRATVIDGARNGDPFSIFIVIHELGHIVMHRAEIPLARMIDGNIKQKFIAESESAEHQANYFARAFLMTQEEVARFSSAEELATECNVPSSHAELRLREIFQDKKHTTPQSIIKEISKLRLSAASTPAEIAKLKAEARKLELWDELPTVPHEDPKKVRLCGNYQIHWDEFGETTQCGWFIENGRIRAHYERYD